jgi:hypothetical protein
MGGGSCRGQDDDDEGTRRELEECATPGETNSPFIAYSLSVFFSLTKYTLPTSPFPSSLIFWNELGVTSTCARQPFIPIPHGRSFRSWILLQEVVEVLTDRVLIELELYVRLNTCL